MDDKFDAYTTIASTGITLSLLEMMDKLRGIHGDIYTYYIIAGSLARARLEADMQIYDNQANSKIIFRSPELSTGRIGNYRVRIIEMDEYVKQANMMLSTDYPVPEDRGDLLIILPLDGLDVESPVIITENPGVNPYSTSAFNN